MRIKITSVIYNKGEIDCNYQHQIQAIIYRFLANSNPDFAAWLHEDGYIYRRDQRFKLFVFSGIIFHGPIKITHSDGSDSTNSSSVFLFHASPTFPFTFSFQIASPVNKFLQHLIEGIFKEGQEISLSRQRVIVQQVESLPDPLGVPTSSNRSGGVSGVLLKPLESPIFVKKPMPSGQRDQYLFPGDEGYEEHLNQNLVHKFETLYGRPYDGDYLKFDFDRTEQWPHPHRLKRSQPKVMKTFRIFKDGKVAGEIKGTLLPFTITGPVELMRIGLDCGFGQNNSMGCGYVAPVHAS